MSLDRAHRLRNIEAQLEASERAERHTPHFYEMLPPTAVMGIDQAANVLTVCAWCPTKAAADAWGTARGYQVSHGICQACAGREFPALIPEAAMCCAQAKYLTCQLQASTEAMRQARARLLGCSVDDLDALDRAVEVARPQAKAEANRLGITEEDFLQMVGDLELDARNEARAETLRSYEDTCEPQEPPL